MSNNLVYGFIQAEELHDPPPQGNNGDPYIEPEPTHTCKSCAKHMGYYRNAVRLANQNPRDNFYKRFAFGMGLALGIGCNRISNDVG